MDRTARKTLSHAIIVPLLSCTILNATGSYAAAGAGGSGYFVKKVLNGNGYLDMQDRALILVPAAAVSAVTALEKQVQQLSEKVEELNFMVLQMQTQIDDLRQGRNPVNAGTGQPERAVTAAAGKENLGDEQTAARPDAETPAVTGSGNAGSARPDAEEHVMVAAKEADQDTAVQAGMAAGGDDIAADTSPAATAKELYQKGYQQILAGDYRAAEMIFRDFQERYPDDPMIGDAGFWLGESLYGQERYREAAQVYIDVQRRYKGADRGPENLLKLGMSMALLEEKNVACATLAEVPKRYKNAEPAILKRVSDERNRISCP